jgi:glutamate-1-semialdehyde aminotransferase
VTGIGSVWRITWDSPGSPSTAMARRFRDAMLEGGVFLPANPAAPAHLRAAFSGEDVDETIDIATAALTTVA